MIICDTTARFPNFQVTVKLAIIDTGSDYTSISIPNHVLDDLCNYSVWAHDDICVVGGAPVTAVALYMINKNIISVKIHELGCVKIKKLHVFPVFLNKDSTKIYTLSHDALVGRDVLFQYESRISRLPTSLDTVSWNLEKFPIDENVDIVDQEDKYSGRFRWMKSRFSDDMTYEWRKTA